ncbi:MAG: hypothetical protein WD470_05470, partial [Rhodospirillaceae bacterium]
MPDAYIDEDAYYEAVEREARAGRATELHNAEFLDFEIGSESDEMRNAITGLVAELRRTQAAATGRESGLNRALMVTLSNLCVNQADDPTRYTAYRRHHDGYPHQRYNPHNAKWRGMKRVVDGLVELGYLETCHGYFDRRFGCGHISRMRATPDFMAYLRQGYGIAANRIRRAENPELIVLRDDEKRPIGYADTAVTRAMRAQLRAYNEVLRDSDIAIDLTEAQIAETAFEPPDLRQKSCYRVFSRGSFERGGRIYGPWWVNAKKALRNHILIAGEPTVECDYGAQHVHIAYSLQGLRFFDVHPEVDDPYEVNGYEGLDRSFRKNALTVALSARDRTGCQTAIRNDIRARPDWAELNIDLPAYLAALEAMHQPISDFL